MSFSKIVVVGSHAPALFIHTNRIPKEGETVIGWDFEAPRDGGKGSNQAIAAARLGGCVSFVGMVGKDRLGEELEIWLEEEGVHYKWLRYHPSLSTGVGFNIQNKEGDCALVTCMGANEGLTEEFVDEALNDLKGYNVFLSQFEIPPQIALHAARTAHSLGMVTIINPAPAVKFNEINLEGISILVPNETEARIIAGIGLDDTFDFKELVHLLHQTTKVETIILTIGQKGIIVFENSKIWMETPPAIANVDASGAGDQFCAALAVKLGQGNSLREACIYAMRAAALSVSRKGTIPAFAYENEL